MKKKSYFQVFFLNFILMLIIPLLTIIIIFWNADRIVRKQILDYASGSLERYSELFDVTIKNMSNACLSIFGRDECKNYYMHSTDDSNKKYIQSFLINDMLESVNDEMYYDVFVYFPTDGKVISATKTTLKSQRYYEVYYDDGIEEHWQEFQSVLSNNSRKPTLYVLNSQGENPYLCVAMNAQGAVKMNYTVCVVLDPVYVQEIYDIRDADENCSFIIFNEEMELLLESNSEMGNSEICKNISLEKFDNDRWYSEENYMLKVRACESISGFYTYVILANSFWKVLSELRLFSFLGIILCVFVSIVIAYRNTVRSYKPVDNLVSRLASKSGIKYEKGNGNEFDFVKIFLDENDKKLRESRSIHKEWYLLKLLRGDMENADINKLDRHSVSFVSDRFLVCILKVNVSQEEKDDLQSFVLQNIFEELGGRNGKGYMVALEKDEYALLVSVTGDIQTLVDDLQYGQKFCEQYFRMFMTLGYSQIHEGMQAIPKCYREAREAMRYQYLLGQGNIISFSQIAERKKRHESEVESRTLQILQKYIRGENSKGVAQFVEEFLQIHNISEASSMDRVEIFRQKVADAMFEIIGKCSGDEEICNERIEELLKQPTLVSFRTYLSYLIQELRKEDTSDEENDELIVKTKNYIDENYWNADLSVTMLGEQIGIRGKYLSKIFKEKYQMGLPDYILHVRIEQAKIYLTQKDMTIQEIAEATGFLSSQVFIRNFKNKEGITPGKFKELV